MNKKVNQDEIEEKSLEILLKGKSKKLKAFTGGWKMKDIKNKKTKNVKGKNNNENNINENNINENNINENTIHRKIFRKCIHDKKLQKVLKIYFGDKNEYELSTYENLIKVSKK